MTAFAGKEAAGWADTLGVEEFAAPDCAEVGTERDTVVLGLLLGAGAEEEVAILHMLFSQV